MQIFSNGDNLHEISNPVFLGKIRKISSIYLSATEFIQREVKVIQRMILPSAYIALMYKSQPLHTEG